MARLKSELEVACPCCQTILVIDTNLGRVVSHKEPERGNKPELSDAQRILAERSGAARSDLPAVGRFGEDARRRAVEAVRRGAASGEGRAGHEADARFRSRLVVVIPSAPSALPLVLAPPSLPRSTAKMPTSSDDDETCFHEETRIVKAHPISTVVVEFRRQRRPALPSAVEDRLAAGKRCAERAIPRAQRVDASVRRRDAAVRVVEQHALDLPDVACPPAASRSRPSAPRCSRRRSR